MKLNLFASCAPGLEELLKQEILELNRAGRLTSDSEPRQVAVRSGGVSFQGDQATLVTALIGLGLAARLLVRIATFRVRHLNDLESHMHRLPWRGWLLPDIPRQIRVTTRKSRLYHTGAVAERILRGIQHRLGDQPATPDDRAPVSLVARLEQDQCTLSLDASGDPLHRRGYRQNPFKAPLREDLARALVKVSGWDGQRPLVDPMCGSGTLLLEAGLLLRQRAPGISRSFGIESTVLGQANLLEQTREVFLQQEVMREVPLIGNDEDPKAIQAAQQNVANAFPGDPLVHQFQWRVGPFQELELPSSALSLISNPPWGGRVLIDRDFQKSTRQRKVPARLASLYAQLGELRRQCPSGSDLTLLTSRRELAYRTGVPLRSAFLTDAGGIKVNAFVETVTADGEEAQGIAVEAID